MSLEDESRERNCCAREKHEGFPQFDHPLGSLEPHLKKPLPTISMSDVGSRHPHLTRFDPDRLIRDVESGRPVAEVDGLVQPDDPITNPGPLSPKLISQLDQRNRVVKTDPLFRLRAVVGRAEDKEQLPVLGRQ
ncbi:MAG: hypothetical protein ACRC33_27820 [Gemmataceae bacterium]